MEKKLYCLKIIEDSILVTLKKSSTAAIVITFLVFNNVITINYSSVTRLNNTRNLV